MSSRKTDPVTPTVARELTIPGQRLRRWLFFTLVVGTTLTAVGMMLQIVRDSGVSPLEVVILLLFAVTFAWISVPFWSAVIGFLLQLLRRDPLSLRRAGSVDADSGSLASKSALVMPIHNEDPLLSTGGLATTMQSLVDTHQADHFEVYLLSDTSDPTIAREEEQAFCGLRQRYPDIGLYYRRRAVNVGRKAGNIEDFCRRWGARQDFIVVLDADSVMSGSCLVHLVQVMEANPRAGLIQTVPVPVRQATLFGRLLQFGACLYSSMLATGQSFWQGDAANYWGHNAILRARPFIDHCRLPVLSGEPPWGGEILSHDFVEAALMRRAGWYVYLLSSIGGSYEEVPGTIPEYARRDRRWAQGSLQHLRLLFARGLHPINRLHFVLGAMGYVSSLLWLLLLLASTAYVVLDGSLDRFITEPHPLLAALPLPGAPPRVSLLVVTLVILFLPKLLALTLALSCRRRSFGGGVRLLLSSLLEIIFAITIAPLMMLYHARSVIGVLSGHSIQWGVRRHTRSTIPWITATRKTAWIVAVGLVWAGVTLYYSPVFILWLMPILLGLLLATPLVRWTSSQGLGSRARRYGLFLVPSETAPPPEVERLPVSRPAHWSKPFRSTVSTSPLVGDRT